MASNNFLKEILQGGACNTDSSQSHIQSSNPVRNFIQDVFLGKARIAQKVGNFYPDQEIQESSQVINPYQNAIINEKIEHQNKREIQRKDMNEFWKIEETKQHNLDKMANKERQQIYKKISKEIPTQNVKKIPEQQRYMHESHSQGYMMNNDFYARPFFPPNHQFYHPRENFYSARQQNEPYLKKNDVQVPIINKESMEKAISLMEKDSDPRFRNSKYLNFLKQVHNGEVEKQNLRNFDTFIGKNNENNLIDEFKKEENEFEFDLEMEAAWDEAEAQVNKDDQKSKEKIVLETCKVDLTKLTNQTQQDIETNNQQEALFEEAFQEAMEEVDREIGESKNEENNEEEIEDFFDLGLQSMYLFSENNPYIQEPHCLEKALDSLNNGDTSKAILYLESILQNKPNDQDIWMLLGKIYQDNDEENQARDCLLKAVNIDTNNLSTLLSLGISLANTSDDFRALKCLSRWISKHPKFEQVAKGDPTLKEICQRTDYKMTLNQLRQYKRDLVDIFEKACKTNPNDPELHCSQAVLHFITRNYDYSLNHFNEALKYDPTNYSLWNKLGSTLAFLSKPSEAIEAYYRALEYKPNFVRAWVNLAATQAFQGEYEEAARLYLTALAINSKAVHVWEYLRITLVALGKHDLAEKINERDLKLYKNYFDVICVEDLPTPEIEYKELHKNYLYKEHAEEWVKAFN